MNGSSIQRTHFSTRDFDTWRQTIDVMFEVEPPKHAVMRPFEVSVDAFQLGEIVLTDARLGDQRYSRSSARARRDGMDHFAFNLYRRGSWQVQTEQGEFQGHTGQISVLDLTHSHISDEPETEIVSLFVPRSLIDAQLPNLSALHGNAPSGPYANLLYEYITLLARQLPDLVTGDGSSLSRATRQMLVACLSPSSECLENARPALEMVLLRRVKRFIDLHLETTNLTAEVVSNALHVSRRTLSRLFQTEGGVQHYIQTMRLERIRKLLSDPNETRRIYEVAATFGFLRSDHFARAFKNQFGYSPREARSEADHLRSPTWLNHSSGKTMMASAGFDDWIRALPS